MLTSLNSGFASIKSCTICIEDANKTIKTIMSIASGKKGFAQLCSLKPICSAEQALFAFEHAHSAIRDKTAFSKSLELEFILRLSASKKIEHALEMLGLRKGKQEALLFIFAETQEIVSEIEKGIIDAINFQEDSELISKNIKQNFSEIQRIYSISDSELNVLSDLPKEKALENAIIERIALVALEG